MVSSSLTIPTKWTSAPDGIIKLNTDTSIRLKNGLSGLRVGARDFADSILIAWVSKRLYIPAIKHQAMVSSSLTIPTKWTSAPDGIIKLNTDTSIRLKNGLSGLRVGARDFADSILIAWVSKRLVCTFVKVISYNSIGHVLAIHALSGSGAIEWKSSFILSQ
ncbi:hypothetical protein ACH5RR_041057 [Cinchona calisaya]|uniref:Uncharacterized protein n=1 Tax=Cinchona calisaya TaxID=153742 RepID=A0ABD2XXV9_9GENT